MSILIHLYRFVYKFGMRTCLRNTNMLPEYGHADASSITEMIALIRMFAYSRTIYAFWKHVRTPEHVNVSHIQIYKSTYNV